jgi:hypothetical protein
MPDRLTHTYAAALQHDLADVPGDATLVGVVRRPTGWFRGVVDENRPELGPPGALLDEFGAEAEAFKMDGLCDEGAHNAAWDAVDFERRYRSHLAASTDAAEALDDLADRVSDGERLALVCFENTDRKRCHRTILVDVLESRL